MSVSIQALVINVTPALDFFITPIDTDTSSCLRQLQDLVGGYIQMVDTPSGATLVCNEEGKLQNMPTNPLATMLWAKLDPNLSQGMTVDFLCGTVVVLGPVDSDGNSTSVTDSTVQTFLGMVNDLVSTIQGKS